MRATALAKQRPWTPPERAPALQPAASPLTRDERLAAWAALLDRCPHVAEVRELDSARRKQMGPLRREGSAASIAFADPSLRAAGLAGDSVDAACAFFGLTADECHRVLCQCGAAAVLPGPAAAATVRRLARRRRLERMRLRFCAGLLAALGALLGLRLLVA